MLVGRAHREASGGRGRQPRRTSVALCDDTALIRNLEAEEKTRWAARRERRVVRRSRSKCRHGGKKKERREKDGRGASRRKPSSISRSLLRRAQDHLRAIICSFAQLCSTFFFSLRQHIHTQSRRCKHTHTHIHVLTRGRFVFWPSPTLLSRSPSFSAAALATELPSPTNTLRGGSTASALRVNHTLVATVRHTPVGLGLRSAHRQRAAREERKGARDQ